MDHLEELVGEPLERDALNERRYARELSLIEAEELRPGIADYLAAAERHGLKRAIVSSSSRRWIDMHLARLERAVGWDAIFAANGDHSRAKPNPVLYLEALDVARRACRRGGRVRGLAERRARREGGRHLHGRHSERGHARTTASRRPTSSSTRSRIFRRTSCSRASADETHERSGEPACDDDEPNRRAQHHCDDSGRDAGEPCVEHERSTACERLRHDQCCQDRGRNHLEQLA